MGRSLGFSVEDVLNGSLLSVYLGFRDPDPVDVFADCALMLLWLVSNGDNSAHEEQSVTV